MKLEATIEEFVEYVKEHVLKSYNEISYQKKFEEGILLYENKEYEKAFNAFLISAYAGNHKAECRVGLAYEKGIGIRQDKGQAIYWYLKAKDHGEAKAMVGLERLGQ